MEYYARACFLSAVFTFSLARYQIFQLISKQIQPTGNTRCHNILYTIYKISIEYIELFLACCHYFNSLPHNAAF